MNRIITVTLNPAIDRIVEVPEYKTGSVLSATKSEIYPAGKGVNVARAIDRLGKEVTAIGIVGKNNVGFFNTLAGGSMVLDWIVTETPTRQNMTIVDPVKCTETHIRDCVHTSEKFPQEELEARLRQHCTEGDIVVFSGSLPENAPVDILGHLCRMCKEMGTKVVIDTSGEPLKHAITSSPDLIKPNLAELQEMVGHRFYTKNEIAAAAKLLADKYSIEKVLVSMGEDGSIIYDGKTGRAFEALLVLRYTHQQLHAVGSGDAMVAAVCVQMLDGADARTMIIDGTAAGAANLFTEGPCDISPEKVDRFRPSVEVVEVHF